MRQTSLKRRLIKIALLSVPVLLFVLLWQMMPRKVELGYFESPRQGRKAAVAALQAQLRRYPIAIRYEVLWQGPYEKLGLGEKTAKIIYEQRKSSLVSKIYYKDVSCGVYPAAVTTCRNVGRSAVFHASAAQEAMLNLPKNCNCTTLTTASGC